MTGPAARPLLGSDLRLRLFAWTFGFGTIFHELEFALEQGRMGPLSTYMETMARIKPTIGWSSDVGLALHAACAALGLLLMVVACTPRGARWCRPALCLLAPVFLLSQLACPDRITSHAGLMAGGLAVVLLLGIAELADRWLARIRRRGSSAAPSADWQGWTRVGLAAVCALTYLFAFYYKLNPDWFSSSSAAPRFLLVPIEPMLEDLGDPSLLRAGLAAAAIYCTLVVELLLPLLLVVRRTRLLGCFVGLLFHLPMIVHGVSDFPVLILAFYPAFFGPGEARELLGRLRASVPPGRVLATAILAAAGAHTLQRSPKLVSLYRNAVGLDPLIPTLNTALTVIALVLAVHLTLTLGGWLLERLRGSAPPAGEWAGDADPPRAGRRATPGSAVAAALAALVCAGFVYLNLAGFFGYPSAGAMTMYSGLKADRRNHFLAPPTRGPNPYSYLRVARFEAVGDAPELRGFRAFLERLTRDGRPPALQLNLLRYHVDRICRAAPGGSVGLTLTGPDGWRLEADDACAVPSLRRYSILPIGDRCSPGCGRHLRDWARGKLAAD